MIKLTHASDRQNHQDGSYSSRQDPFEGTAVSHSQKESLKHTTSQKLMGLASILILLTSGCASTKPLHESVAGIPPAQRLIPSIAATNAAILNRRYEDEWQYNRGGRTDDIPTLGLALSGGGIRSGFFSIGVLQGLNEIGLLTNVDLISTVSGGGYAGSWYCLQTLATGNKNQDIFSNDKQWQVYLTQHGELVSRWFAAEQTCLRRSEYVLVDFPLTVLSQPVNLVLNGIFGMHANVVPMRRVYESGIDRDFHVIPNNKLEGKVYSTSFESLSNGIYGQLPFPIVNMTAHIEDAPAEEAGLLENRVFEFTPLHYGSDYFRYWSQNYPINYNRAIEVSGAAADSKTANEPTQRLFYSALNIDLGYFIDNPNPDISTFGRWARKLIPIPFYPFSSRYQRDNEGDRIYLADGGHSENLGAYSLVRRMCRSIIVVDAEQDSNYEFEAYTKLKTALRREMGVDFRVKEIDDALQLSSENRKVVIGRQPVMIGEISSFPRQIKSNGAIEDLVIRVIYIKLSLDRTKVDDGTYPETVSNFYQTHQTDFPQRTTLDQSYPPDQVKAYRDLGYFMIKAYANEIQDECRAAVSDYRGHAAIRN